MMGWLRRRAQMSIAKSMRADLQRYTNYLRGGTSSEVAEVLALATTARLVLREQAEGAPGPSRTILDALYSGEMTDENYLAPISLGSMIKTAQKQGNLRFANGLMVWFHTIRAYSNVDVRVDAQEMWAQLKRGFPKLREVIAEYAIHDKDSFEEQCRWIPYAMDLSQE